MKIKTSAYPFVGHSSTHNSVRAGLQAISRKKNPDSGMIGTESGIRDEKN